MSSKIVVSAADDDYSYEDPPTAANNPKAKPNKYLILVLSLLLALLVVGIIVIITLYVVANNVGYAYALMIDAGSTSSKISILKWLDYPFRKNGWVEQVNYKVEEPGISAYSDSPPEAGEKLLPVLRNMLLENVPEEKRESTSLYLAATAGMRLLDINEPLKSDAILQNLRQQLPSAGATVHNVFSDIRIITGNTEGRYGWVAANYLDKKLGDPEGMPPKPANEMVGMLDLGGASTQIAFVPAGTGPAQHTMPINMFGQSYNLYSYSFLCYGKEANNRRYLAQLISKANTSTSNMPSKLKIVGEGNTSKCNAEVSRLFPKKECTQGTCSFNNVYQPAVRGKFFAFSGFVFVIDFLKFPTGGKNLTRSQVRAAVDAFCHKNWSEVNATTKPSTLKYVASYCFDGHYIENLLDGYGFKEDGSWRNIEFARKVINSFKDFSTFQRRTE
ncbi:unnamed protein product [Dibothriocephalus latus]|uniref:Ectonucleoside triphosphate diphosphohydrolase 1 n=1 Tax=Dibothriocephalus latus TaxID=60516 RepID=A0A3P6S9Y9_DIBLA|nr:unnamed protein product [Dibothriocephalus latus]